MTARRAREVRIRRGQRNVFYAYRRAFESTWRGKHPYGMWVDYAAVSRAMLEAHPWLEGWGPVDAFAVHMATYTELSVRNRDAELDAMFHPAPAPDRPS